MTTFTCQACGGSHDAFAAAFRCCTDNEHDCEVVDDYGEAPPSGIPPERHAYEQRLQTDGGHHEGIEITPLPYQCRLCTREETVYVNVDTIETERYVDAHNARLIRTYCEDCHTERPFVLATDEADAARDEHPIQAVRDLQAKREGQPLRADGGVPDVPADTTVYVTTTQRGSRHTNVFHTDRECPRLQQSNNTHEKRRGVLGDTKTHCKFCAGVADTPIGDHSLNQALAEADPGDLVTDGGGCPNCGAQTRREGGCPTCRECGWSKCGGAF